MHELIIRKRTITCPFEQLYMLYMASCPLYLSIID